jgi:hypothetical protein
MLRQTLVSLVLAAAAVQRVAAVIPVGGLCMCQIDAPPRVQSSHHDCYPRCWNCWPDPCESILSQLLQTEIRLRLYASQDVCTHEKDTLPIPHS